MDDQQSEILGQIWQLLSRGAVDRRSPLHTPTVASITPDGRPDARVMVLRKAEQTPARLRFHTDARSPKCAALDGQHVTVLGYDAPHAIQLRIHGYGVVQTQGHEADAAWAASSLFARRCYLAQDPPGTSLAAPGSNLPPEIEGQQPTEAQITPARPNFALLIVRVLSIDWLHLANTGHRRARFTRSAADWSAEWLAP